MKPLFALAALALAGCPSHETPIYHHLNEPGAMETCKGSMPNFDYTATGSSKQDARDKGYAAIRDTVTKNQACGALIMQETDPQGPGNDGLWYVGFHFQTCGCR
jgi:hypothetical protein